MEDNLQLNIDTTQLEAFISALNSLKNTTETLVDKIGSLNNELDDNSDEAKEASRETKNLDREQKKLANGGLKDVVRGLKDSKTEAGKALDGFTKLAAGGAAIAGLAVAVKGLEIASKAVVSFLKEGFQELISTNAELKKASEDAQKAFKELKAEVAQLIIPADKLEEVFNLIAITIESVTKEVQDLRAENGSLISNMDQVKGVIIGVAEVLEGLHEGFLALKAGVSAVTLPIRILQEAFQSLIALIASVVLQGLSNLLEGFTLAARGAASLARALGQEGMAAAADSAANSLSEAARQARNLRDTQLEYVRNTGRRIQEQINETSEAFNRVTSATSLWGNAIRNLRDALDNGTRAQRNNNEETERGNRALRQRRTEIQELLSPEKQLAQTLGMTRKEYDAFIQTRNEELLVAGRIKQAREDEIKQLGEIARLQQLNAAAKTLAAGDANKAAEIAQAEKLSELEFERTEAERNRLENLSSLYGVGMAEIANATAGIASGFAAAIGQGENLGDASRKLVGELITSLGQSAVAAGAVALIGDPTTGWFPNPARGAALIGAGGAAIALGSALGASGGGGGGSKPSAPPGRTSNARTNYDLNSEMMMQPSSSQAGVVVNFNGVVGDPVAVARQLDRVQTQGSRSGFVN